MDVCKPLAGGNRWHAANAVKYLACLAVVRPGSICSPHYETIPCSPKGGMFFFKVV